MKRLSHAFTLVEMMVVVALVAIILALAVPSFNDMIARQRVRSITDELVTDIRYARSEALTNARAARIFVGPSTSGSVTCYTVYFGTFVSRCTCSSAGSTCTGQAIELKTVIVPRSTSVGITQTNMPQRYVRFTEQQGRAEPGDAWIDVVSTRSGHLRTLINPTGLPSVCSPDGSIAGVPTCSEPAQ